MVIVEEQLQGKWEGLVEKWEKGPKWGSRQWGMEDKEMIWNIMSQSQQPFYIYIRLQKVGQPS